MQLYSYIPTTTAISHNYSDGRGCARASRAVFTIVRFHLSARALFSGFCAMVVECSVPFGF